MFDINESCKSSDSTFYADCVLRKQRFKSYGILLIITILVIIIVTTTSLLSNSYWQYVLVGALLIGAVGVVAYTEKFVHARAVNEFNKFHDINNFGKRYSEYKKIPNISSEIESPYVLVPRTADTQYNFDY